MSDVSGSEIKDGTGSGVELFEQPNPSVVTLGQQKSRMVGGGQINDSSVRGAMGNKYAMDMKQADEQLDQLMQNSLIKN